MPLTRVYVPLRAADLDALAAGSDLGPAPLDAHGVTPALGGGGRADDEALEHEAWVAAADAATSRAAGGRRIVASADVDAADVAVPATPDVPSRVRVSTTVPRRRVVSFHVDENVGDTGTADLLWFDVTELDAVRAHVSSP